LRSGCPVKGGAWLQRFDDVARVEKSCIAKAKKGKNEGNVSLQLNMQFPKHGMHGSLRCLKILYIHNC